ncbi:prostaglandin E2 receptor EP4 subtype-like [Penaeus monodon]|uniref:prostaglandin E2 receptor EP4 subtype-like n=1 Tax=Penaeus monodon TaxID=6687 RepID=UPI0018A6F63E|nr:prostaglandin E2 receptor EP4 subtype-like [Penaeus monodon]
MSTSGNCSCNTWDLVLPNLHLCPTTPLRHRIFTTTMGVINISNLVVIVVCNVLVVGNLLKMRVSRHLPSDHHRNNFRFRGGWDHELQMVLVLLAITCVAIVSWGPLDTILVTNQFWPPHLKPGDHMGELQAVRLASVNQIADPWIYIIVRVVSFNFFLLLLLFCFLLRGWWEPDAWATACFPHSFTQAQTLPIRESVETIIP